MRTVDKNIIIVDAKFTINKYIIANMKMIMDIELFFFFF